MKAGRNRKKSVSLQRYMLKEKYKKYKDFFPADLWAILIMIIMLVIMLFVIL